ncbi:MAG: TIGR00267 family protein [Hadesarchaea archaeon]|nr:MAG: TIGR00267 family protein [Hadesarchaea archaeon]HDI12976.1 TIGR00267 family protein [Hadesarchaea archaeon]
MSRYHIRGLIDGSLSTLGIVIGASIVIGLSSEATRIIISAGIGGGIANGLSNILGAFAAEKTVAYKKLEKIERAMLKRGAIRNSRQYKKTERVVLSSGIADGLATIGGSMIPVLPFFILPAILALEWSVAITLALFFAIGAYIGKISRENLLLSGFKMVVFAGLTAGAAVLVKMLI